MSLRLFGKQFIVSHIGQHQQNSGWWDRESLPIFYSGVLEGRFWEVLEIAIWLRHLI